jgi:hypothetical protein
MKHYLAQGALALSASLVLLAAPAHAQNKPDAPEDQPESEPVILFNDPAKDEKLFDFSYVSPGTPVLPLIGVDGDQITRIGALRTFAIAVLPGLDGSGKGTAVALDIAPFWAFGGADTNLAQYYEMSPLDRVFARSKASVAMAWGDSAAGRPSSFVLSYGSRLLDGTDKLADKGFDRCLDKWNFDSALDSDQDRMFEQLQKIPGFENMTALEQLEAIQGLKNKRSDLVEKIYSTCVTEQARRMERASGLDAGVGIRFNGRPGSLDGLEQTGTVFWSTWTSGVFGGPAEGERATGPISGLRARAAVSFRYTLKEAVFSDTFALEGKRDSLALVGGIESAPPLDPAAQDSFRWGLQVGWNRQSAVLPTEEDRDYLRYQALAQVRLGGSVWLNATVGRVSGRGVETDTQATIGFTFTPPSKAARIAEAYATR